MLSGRPSGGDGWGMDPPDHEAINVALAIGAHFPARAAGHVAAPDGDACRLVTWPALTRPDPS